MFQKELVFENNISIKTYFSSYDLLKNYFFEDINKKILYFQRRYIFE